MSFQNITVVITSFKSREKIFNLLNSIDGRVKVIVIENSNDADLKKDIENKYNNVECILSSKNLGYAKGNNLGLTKVKTKYALIVNPDAELGQNTFKNFFISAEKNPEFTIISPLVQEKKDIEKYYNLKNDKLIEVENVKGFAMFLNLKKFDDIGFFDDNFFIYFEEIDLCKRLRKKDKKLFLDPSILISHIGGSSHDNEINFEMEVSRNWHWMWSSFYFYKKHYGYFFALLKMSRKLFSAFIKSTFYYLLKNTKKNKIYFSRLSGLMSSILMKKSWYRPKID
ncbi:MAG: glycosyltransferase [Candidatus Pelagibacter sp. TMED165]|nr:MAG: glycosyltransferase [Candidatus Pelagibacter sp. TMED165]|tara:strand:+ start:707 stop:1555 length:849 start_codon:yes stop_codon:yes gene_type:complete